jgi:chromosome segregation ATPase
VFFDSGRYAIFQVVQALDLSKAHMHRHAVEVEEKARVTELEADNAKLLAELKQACLALAEADAAWSSLSASRERMEHECTGLGTTIDMLKGENAHLVTDCEAKVAAMNKKFWDYRIDHHKRLHELRGDVEKAVNEIGV